MAGAGAGAGGVCYFDQNIGETKYTLSGKDVKNKMAFQRKVSVSCSRCSFYLLSIGFYIYNDLKQERTGFS